MSSLHLKISGMHCHNCQAKVERALKAVPGGTVQRVETDAEGDAYEAHMLDANGNPVTVKFDKDFNVTKTETGGPGGPGHGRGDQPPAA